MGEDLGLVVDQFKFTTKRTELMSLLSQVDREINVTACRVFLIACLKATVGLPVTFSTMSGGAFPRVDAVVNYRL